MLRQSWVVRLPKKGDGFVGERIRQVHVKFLTTRTQSKCQSWQKLDWTEKEREECVDCGLWIVDLEVFQFP